MHWGLPPGPGRSLVARVVCAGQSIIFSSSLFTSLLLHSILQCPAHSTPLSWRSSVSSFWAIAESNLCLASAPSKAAMRLAASAPYSRTPFSPIPSPFRINCLTRDNRQPFSAFDARPLAYLAMAALRPASFVYSRRRRLPFPHGYLIPFLIALLPQSPLLCC